MFWSSLPSIRAFNSTAASQAKVPPTAVFVGGTSGIGEGMAITFGEDTKGNANIIIVGRNRQAAEKILAGLPLPQSSSSTPVREFVECDVTSMKNVQQAAEQILKKHNKINYLILSPGFMTMQGYTPTSEGIDRKLAVHYYGRWKFIHDLLPALNKAKEAGEEGKVLSVLGAGYGGSVDPDDFGLQKPGAYSTSAAGLVAPTLNDLMMQKFASLNPSLTFIQSSPGGVRTSILASSPSRFLRCMDVLTPVFSPLLTKPRDCGAYMWHGIYKTAATPGAWRIGSSGQDLKNYRIFGDEVQREKLWEHTTKVVSEANSTVDVQQQHSSEPSKSKMFWSSLPPIRAFNSTAASQARVPPTAVFVGGTAGIGEGLAITFGEDTKGNANIIIVGRNKQAAERILADIPLPQSSSNTVVREFVECDVTSMKNVQKAAKQILEKHNKINYLVLSPGFMTMQGYTPTSEGIDRKLAVHYYGRWKFIHDLLPALNKAKEAGEEAKVLSVLGAGYGGSVKSDDFGLQKPGAYSVTSVSLAAPTYNDLMIQKFASLNPSLTFIHATPGAVRTSIFASSPSRLLRWMDVLTPVFSPLMTKPRDCGAYMWHGIYKTAATPGAWRIGASGQDLKNYRIFGDEAQREALWEHTKKFVDYGGGRLLAVSKMFGSSPLPSIRASNATAASQATVPPTAVFVGGTSGIGEGMAITFAENTKGNANIIIVGRNRLAAEKILAGLPLPQSSSNALVREFVECDVTSMKTVQQVAEEIPKKHNKINYLILSPGFMTTQGYTPTPEGIDRKLAVHYYGRWKFIYDLLPALHRAKEAGEEAKVLSVSGAGHGGPANPDDFGLQKPGAYSSGAAGLVTPTYTDLMMRKFAHLNPSLTFIQANPGAVRTAILASSPSRMLRYMNVLTPVLSPLLIDPRDCGAYLWHGIYKTATTPGAWRIGSNGQDLKDYRVFGDEVQRDQLWEHTTKVVSDAVSSQ
ncbi:hypothetical protein CVT24_000315 [Panaeolus cyanescens]|uniref:Ketoreductase (KR) domain-containing protein n=1 Tax=Panaeolus cyanescens TaxID=181874 RepID=A0A409YCY7_9AGAR|nr:hypothetical protein CVT24_000315 [Panaeolus cyanescens]